MSDGLVMVIVILVFCGIWYYIANGLPRLPPKGPPISKAESLKDRRID